MNKLFALSLLSALFGFSIAFSGEANWPGRGKIVAMSVEDQDSLRAEILARCRARFPPESMVSLEKQINHPGFIAVLEKLGRVPGLSDAAEGFEVVSCCEFRVKKEGVPIVQRALDEFAEDVFQLPGDPGAGAEAKQPE